MYGLIAAFAMAYKFWDDTQAPLPAELAAKRELGQTVYDNFMSWAHAKQIYALCAI